MQEHGSDKAPPLMLLIDQDIQFRTIVDQHRWGKCPQVVARHTTRSPHQQKQKKVRDQKNDGENVRTAEDCARKTQRLAIISNRSAAGTLRLGLEWRTADGASILSGADDGAATATDAGSSRLSSLWFAFKQESLSENKRDA